MQDSIFTKIINGEIPAHKIYEDDEVLAFLDIHPVSEGHTLVIPKKQIEFVWDLEDQDYVVLALAVRKVAHHLKDVLGVPYVGEQIIGADVPHAHIHLIPFTRPIEFHKEADMSAEPNHAALAALAEKLKF